MADAVIMPKLGMSMVEGTVIAWKKKIGDPVAKGEGIVDISSEKIEAEVESPADGILLDIEVPEGEVVPYGTVLGYVGQPGEKIEKYAQPSDKTAANQEAAATAVAEDKAAEQVAAAPAASKNGNLKISPVARKMAEEAGLNLELIVGTGPQGRITKEDVEKALASQAAAPASAPAHSESQSERGKRQPEPAQRQPQPVQSQPEPAQEEVASTPVTGMRKVIAARMHESLQQSAQLTLTIKADVTGLRRLQKQLAAEVQQRYGGKLTVTDFIARAIVLSLLAHKQMNSAYLGDRIESYGHVHLGIAVALEKGLVVPVIPHAQRLTLIELSQSIKSLSERARNNQLSAEEMKGSTFTITNLGAYGVEFFTPVLNPPESGILGVGAVEEMPVYRGEELQRRSMLPLSLTFDHRVLDGAPAAQFLGAVKRYLEEPHSLLI